MENNIKFSFDFTISKIAGLYLIVAAPFIVSQALTITCISIGAGLIGWKQGMDTIKKTRGGKNE